jgi:hypothetical protein
MSPIGTSEADMNQSPRITDTESLRRSGPHARLGREAACDPELALQGSGRGRSPEVFFGHYQAASWRKWRMCQSASPDVDRLSSLTRGCRSLPTQLRSQVGTLVSTTKERLKVQEWLNYIASELHKGFSPLFNSATPDAYKAIVKTNLAKQFAYLDKSLAGKDYLTGKNFTVADAYLFTIMNWRHMHKIDISGYKNLSAYLDRVGARLKVREAMQAEGLLKAA